MNDASAQNLTPYREFMIDLAQRSGDFIRPHFGNPSLAVEIKSDKSPVTVADKGAEELMRGLIAKKFPTHGIVGEEFGNERADAEWVWVLDPIDGTKAFITGVPLWGTLIALKYRGQPVLGVIHQPILNQLMVGDCKTTTLNGRAVRVRDCANIEDATILTSDPIGNPHKYQNGAAHDALLARARIARTWGDCYGYLLVSGGWADVMLDPIMNPWDIQALIPIVRGAGGIITDWHGGDPVGADSIIAASPNIHAQIVTALR